VTYAQAPLCIKGRQGSSVDRPCQLSFCEQVLASTESGGLLPQSIQCRVCGTGPAWDSKQVLDVLRWKKIKPVHLPLPAYDQCLVTGLSYMAYDQCLVTLVTIDTPGLFTVNTAATKSGNEVHSRGGEGLAP